MFERLHDLGAKVGDTRTPSEIDRDRVLYSDYLRRLAAVTQVVGPLEGHVFHNRLTHSLKVAQLSRRLAEHLLRSQPQDSDLRSDPWGVDPDVVEAAGLAHDLGHPPFGHVAEHELDRLAAHHGGFEGNAQTFRILTRLAVHSSAHPGLNLTIRTLNAVLKYPHLRTEWNGRGDRPKKHRKFGAYSSDRVAFDEVQGKRPPGATGRTLEAEIMNHADDVAYSIHDFEDFYRAGLLPVGELLRGENEWKRLWDWLRNTERVSAESAETFGTLRSSSANPCREVLHSLHADKPHEGSREDRLYLRGAASELIQRFLYAASLESAAAGASALRVDAHTTTLMEFLQGIIFRYVIANPALATQQHGQRQIIQRLFNSYLTAIQDGGEEAVRLIPAAYQYRLEEIKGLPAPQAEVERTRLAVDIVAGLTDAQAVAIDQRLLGHTLGSVTDLVPR